MWCAQDGEYGANRDFFAVDGSSDDSLDVENLSTQGAHACGCWWRLGTGVSLSLTADIEMMGIDGNDSVERVGVGMPPPLDFDVRPAPNAARDRTVVRVLLCADCRAK